MKKNQIEETVTNLVLPIVEKHSFELIDVEYVKEGSNWYLRVYIDKPGGITIDDCHAVSTQLNEDIDRIDPIKSAYYLEVSSPGLERPLKKDRDFEKYKGQLVEVKLFKSIDGQKLFKGELLGLIDGKITIKQEGGETVEFERDMVSLVKRVVVF